MTIGLLAIHPAQGLPALEEALASWGHGLSPEPGDGTVVIVADRPDPRWIPPSGSEILWWVKEADPEEVSLVLSLRFGWVARQDQPLDRVREALHRIRSRDLGSDGWLRQMIHLATLDELLRPILARAMGLSAARGGAIWIRQEESFFQRCGAGFPEAPVGFSEAEALVEAGEAFFLCPREKLGLLRLVEPRAPQDTFLGWITEVDDLLVKAWNLEQSRNLSYRDDLTVAYNRRCLEVELPQAIRSASVRGESVALLFLDVDNLKELNSQFGHPTGSRVISTVALEAKQIIRNLDRLYRYGGDEFCIIIPGSTAPVAAKIGERLLNALVRSPLQVGKVKVAVSISVGVASFPADADGADHLLEKADRALLKAKASGKGCVMLADETRNLDK
ncbi:GGDEF domain-containing protein [Geothrix sp. 21YS21S-2]|uniref:GGDEF domain-containing protein n=1 Tax=Geothrix sp. 21YS21S-2 TaxID=3068893 RepID=UPI0027B962B3|nr:GGDEF domain-containing protein [Geothrix sp. 21YS21S-2]